MTLIKPPLGLRPRFIVAEHRLDEINAAIARYVAASVPVPQDWVDEYNELVAYLRRYRDR